MQAVVVAQSVQSLANGTLMDINHLKLSVVLMRLMAL
jgi:hypothetical protein